MVESFPCLICGKSLERVIPEYEAQPYEGVSCSTHGNYGSRVFDSMDGELIAFNICDECFVEAGDKGRLFYRQTMKPITVNKVVTAYEPIERPYLPWKNGMGNDLQAEEWSIEDVENNESKLQLLVSIDDLKDYTKVTEE